MIVRGRSPDEQPGKRGDQKRGLALNQRAAETAANGVDWLFKRDTLIKSGRTWFELVHDGDLMAVRYYALPDEDEIELVDGSTMPIQRVQHAVPLVLVPPLGVTTETFDLMPQRSLVRYLVASGFKVYLVDWGKPKKSTVTWVSRTTHTPCWAARWRMSASTPAAGIFP